jgi:hypothetical protein
LKFLENETTNLLYYEDGILNKAVGFRLVTKFGEKGVVNLGKAVPLVGGFIGGAVDGIGTNIVGKTVKKVFI